MSARPVLLVEDDASIRDVVSECLALEGYEVVHATNGGDALAWLRSARARPCVVLLDLVMPVMTGAQLLRQMRHDLGLAGVPVVLMTAAALPASDLPQAEAVLEKPFELSELLDVVARFCRRADPA